MASGLVPKTRSTFIVMMSIFYTTTMSNFLQNYKLNVTTESKNILFYIDFKCNNLEISGKIPVHSNGHDVSLLFSVFFSSCFFGFLWDAFLN